jgi:hypothetical protein
VRKHIDFCKDPPQVILPAARGVRVPQHIEHILLEFQLKLNLQRHFSIDLLTHIAEVSVTAVA